MIHIIQWICPERHCLLGVAYDSKKETHDNSVAVLKQYAAILGAIPKCFVCGSVDLSYEDNPTEFNTMEEAAQAIFALQEANIRARTMIAAARASRN